MVDHGNDAPSLEDSRYVVRGTQWRQFTSITEEVGNEKLGDLD